MGNVSLGPLNFGAGAAGVNRPTGGGPGPGPGPRRPASAPWVLGLSAAALVGWSALAAAGVGPFAAWYYLFAWYTTLLLLDAGLAWREGAWPLLGRPRFALSLWLWSVPTWLLFEALNFRLANWYYVNVPEPLLLRRANALLAFATVLPAIHLGHRWMESLGLARGLRSPRFPVGARVRAGTAAAGVLFLALALWRPRTFFPLVWGAVTLLLEPWNHARSPRGSLLGDLSRGRPGRIVRLLAGGAVIGLLWETFNTFATTRWIYTVPGLEDVKLFEMPILGYLGFPVFALDCFVIHRALVTLRVAVPGWAASDPELGVSPRRVPAAAVAALLFAAAVTAGMDRWTVDSLHPEPADLPGATPEIASALAGAEYGDVDRLARADPERVAGAAGLPAETAATLVRGARLATLRGIGARNARALFAAGIETACELARADPEAVSAEVRAHHPGPRAGFPPRIRVWIRAAGAACEEGR